MNRIAYAIAIAGLSVSAAETSAEQFQFPPIFGTTPDASVEHWIKYVVVGPRDAPFPVVLISPQRFETSGIAESLIVLPQPRYDVVAGFTQATTACSDCCSTKTKLEKWYTVEISQYSNGTTRTCVLLQAPACRYLSSLIRLDEVKWSADEQEPITHFMRSIKCEDG